MKKAFDQTVRDIKREVNKKVLKVPSIEQKVLDATSNEPWGPHGTHLADIAQASRNYHECQMIMTIIWKRINDTGKNWRHVYKALTVLEYLVAHGADRVVDEIREHAYQISTLSDFQYIDSSGRDQGSNVRKKSQTLVSLVNDKERIQEVRQKASANRDKFRSTSGAGMYRPGSYSGMGGYDDDRYGSRDEDRNGYGREREWGDERNGRYGDSYGRDGDRYGSNEERYSRDGYRDDDYQGRSRSVDDSNNGSRGRSSDRERERGYDDDGQYSSSRGSGAKADDHSQDGRRLDRKYSEQNLSAPPSYEEAVGEGRSPVHSERDGETSTAFAPKSSSPTAGTGPQANAASTPAAPAAAPPPVAAAAASPAQSPPAPTANKETVGFDEFDPRGSFSAAPTTSSNAEMDLLGSLSESFSSNSLAIVPTPTTSFEAGAFTNSSSAQAYVATSSATSNQQTFDDPFGDGPFRATPSSEEFSAQPQSASYSNQSSEPTPPVAPNVESVNNVGFGGSYPSTTHGTHNVPNFEVPSAGPQNPYQEMSTPNNDIDILADILPPSGPSPPNPSQTGFLAQTNQFPTQAGFPAQTGQSVSHGGFMAQASQPPSQTGFAAQPASHGGFMAQASQPPSQTGFAPQPGQPSFVSSYTGQQGQPPSMPGFSVQGGQQPMPQPGFLPNGGQNGSLAGFPSQMGHVTQPGFLPPGSQPTQPPSGNYYGSFQPQPGSTAPVPPMSQVTSTQTAQYNNSNFYQQLGSAAPVSSQMQSNTSLASQPSLTASTGALALVSQPAKEFQTKSTVWADTLNRGLVNLNISGPKTNPLSDIGIDFDALNRKEKRMEKPSATPVTSTVTMGKAMGAGSGIGRAGAGALRAPPNPMMGSGMGIGMGGGPGVGPPVGGYGAVNQPMGVGIGMNMPGNMGQGFQMQQPAGFPPGSTMPGGYNPMMGRGGYGQQPYGSGYR